MQWMIQRLALVALFIPIRAAVGRSKTRGSKEIHRNQRRLSNMNKLTYTPSLQLVPATSSPTLRPTIQAPVVTFTGPPSDGFFNEPKVGNTIILGNRTPAVDDNPMMLSTDGKTLAVVDPSVMQHGLTIGQTVIYRLNKQKRWTILGTFAGGASATDSRTNVARSSVALSGDGNTLVVATNPINVSNYVVPITVFNGSVTIYRFVSNKRWKKMGHELTFGPTYSLSVAVSSNGTVLAVTNGLSSNGVSVYQWNNNSDWRPLGDIIPLPIEISSQVSLSADGSVVAVAAYQIKVSGYSCCGAIQVFKYMASAWVQLGQSIVGDPTAFRSYIGKSVSLSASGMRFATGVLSEHSQKLLIYEFDSSLLRDWILVGSFGATGEQVVLSADGKPVAASGRYTSSMIQSGLPVVEVFREINNVTWTQVGSDIGLGLAVALSGDAKSVAVYVDKFYVVGRDYYHNITVTVYGI